MTTPTKYNTVSFETAQRLREAGVELKTAFLYDGNGALWVEDNDPQDTFEEDLAFIRLSDRSIVYGRYSNALRAPTFQELWDALPKEIALSYGNYLLSITPVQDIYSIGYGSLFAIAIDGLTEAIAELLLLLKENGLLPS